MASRPPTSPSVSVSVIALHHSTEGFQRYQSRLPQFLSLIFFTGEKFRNDGVVGVFSLSPIITPLGIQGLLGCLNLVYRLHDINHYGQYYDLCGQCLYGREDAEQFDTWQ